MQCTIVAAYRLHYVFMLVVPITMTTHGPGPSATEPSGVGVIKPISSVPLFSEIFSIVKTRVSYWISRLYLAGVAAA